MDVDQPPVVRVAAREDLPGEIRRCLERCIFRDLYRLLEHPTAA
ncbi:hypothetical protein [Nocardioides taihuensis]|uniref:Uncharacterized protein n=1 Tax=Nocardioides taihuensis TaxID=1835606 RepID=A0ABW0BR57_9ACTN